MPTNKDVRFYFEQYLLLEAGKLLLFPKIVEIAQQETQKYSSIRFGFIVGSFADRQIGHTADYKCRLNSFKLDKKLTETEFFQTVHRIHYAFLHPGDIDLLCVFSDKLSSEEAHQIRHELTDMLNDRLRATVHDMYSHMPFIYPYLYFDFDYRDMLSETQFSTVLQNYKNDLASHLQTRFVDDCFKYNRGILYHINEPDMQILQQFESYRRKTSQPRSVHAQMKVFHKYVSELRELGLPQIRSMGTERLEQWLR